MGSWRACRRLLASAHSDLDGLIAGSDHISRGVIDALCEEGGLVVDDVSEVGFDNWVVLVGESGPPLMGVDTNLDDPGRSAAQALVEAIDCLPHAGQHMEPARLVVREFGGLTESGYVSAPGHRFCTA